MSFGLDDVLNNLFAQDRQEDAQQFNSGEASLARGFNSAEAVAQRDWAERMSNTQYQRSTRDLMDAGLNPMMAAMHGGAGVPTGAAANTSAASAGIAGPGGGGGTASMLQASSAIDVNKAMAGKLTAEKENIEADTRNKPIHGEQMQQQIAESSVRIEQIWEQANLEKHSAVNVQQQTTNLTEAVDLIRAQVGNLKALTAQAGATTTEINQRVKANLPNLEAILLQLETMQKRLLTPGMENAATAADSLVGMIGAYLKALGGVPAAVGVMPTGRAAPARNTTIHNHNR